MMGATPVRDSSPLDIEGNDVYDYFAVGVSTGGRLLVGITSKRMALNCGPCASMARLFMEALTYWIPSCSFINYSASGGAVRVRVSPLPFSCDRSSQQQKG